jgi:trigger factor
MTTLKIETVRNDDCTATLTVEVDPAQVQAALRVAAKKVAGQYNFPGFRRGKAPYETVLRHVGEKALMEVALEDLGQKVYQEAVTQEKLEVAAPGALEDAQFDPMVLKFSVPLRPVVDLGDYRARRLPYEPPAVEEAQLEKALEDLRERQAVLEPVERPAAMGDVVTCDIKAYLHEGENPSDYLMTQPNMSLLLDEKEPDRELPGLEQQVVGMSAGEEKKFDLTFPEDFANTSLRGQVAHVEVKCKEIKRRNLPEWSDELAKAVGDFETVEELRRHVREDLQSQAEADANRTYATNVVDELVAASTVKYPPVLLEHQLDDLMEDLDQNLQQRQRMKLEDYIKIKGQTMEEFRNENRERAEASLKRTLVLTEVIEREGLSVEKDEVDGRATLLEAQLGANVDPKLRQAIASDRIRSSLALDLLTDKVYSRLVALAKGEDIPLSAAEQEPAAPEPVAAPEATAAPAEPATEPAVAEEKPADNAA